jgi:electron transport complex protein RnfB
LINKLELINLIHKELPQIQCGRCDTPGCHQYAEAIVAGAPHDRCVPGGEDTLKALNKLLENNLASVNLEYGPTIGSQKVTIIEEECIGCKKCITACPVDAIIGAANLMHSVIDDICTGCELCIEPCPVDCIEIVEVAIYDIDQPRKISQSFYNLKENLNLNSERSKIKNLSDENMNISNSINTQISNRKIDKQIGLKEMQHKIAKADLEKLHNYDQLEIDKFINKGLKK